MRKCQKKADGKSDGTVEKTEESREINTVNLYHKTLEKLAA